MIHHPYRSSSVSVEQIDRSRRPVILPFIEQNGEWIAPMVLVLLFLLGILGGRGCG